MKTSRLLSLLTALGVSALFSAPASADPPIPVTTDEVLQIVIHDNVMRKTRDYWTTSRMETERYNVMRYALTNSAKKLGTKGEFKVERFAAGIEEANQRLTLYVYRWEEGLESFGRSMTVEFAMDAVLRVGDQEWDMGAFTARSSHYAAGGPSSEDFAPAAERAIEQLVELYRAAIAEAATTGK